MSRLLSARRTSAARTDSTASPGIFTRISQGPAVTASGWENKIRKYEFTLPNLACSGVRTIEVGRHIAEMVKDRNLATVCGYDYVVDYPEWKRRFDEGPILRGY